MKTYTKEELIEFFNRFELFINLIVTTIFGLIWLSLIPYWQTFLIIGIVSGTISYRSSLKSFAISFIGVLLAQLLYFNVNFPTVIESVELTFSSLGLSGFGLLITIIILLLWSFYSSLGSLISSNIIQMVIHRKVLMVKEL